MSVIRFSSVLFCILILMFSSVANTKSISGRYESFAIYVDDLERYRSPRGVDQSKILTSGAVTFSRDELALPSAADGSVFDSQFRQLEFYNSPTSAEPTLVLGVEKLVFPAAVLAVSANGMLQVRVGDSLYWLASDDVKTNVRVEIFTVCDPLRCGILN